MTALPPLFASALPGRPDLLETLSYQAVGLVVVFSVLGSIWICMELMGCFFRGRDGVRMPLPAPPSVVPPADAEPSISPGEMSPELRVAIIAAVSIALERPVRVISCTERVVAHPSEFNTQMLAYASDGRRRQLDSHRPR